MTLQEPTRKHLLEDDCGNPATWHMLNRPCQKENDGAAAGKGRCSMVADDNDAKFRLGQNATVLEDRRARFQNMRAFRCWKESYTTNCCCGNKESYRILAQYWPGWVFAGENLAYSNEPDILVVASSSSNLDILIRLFRSPRTMNLKEIRLLGICRVFPGKARIARRIDPRP
eukprot:scaffold4306_cov154-Cylindrotheca_fusiformis.AAC.2